MKNTIEELKNKIAKRNQENERDKKLIDEAKPVDGWYVDTDTHSINWMFYKKDGLFIFGIDCALKWKDCQDYGFATLDRPLERLATPEESTKRLAEFVNGLGYKKGVTVELGTVNRKSKLKGDVRLSYNSEFNRYAICFGSDILWKTSNDKGWAKIVKQKPKYTVECKEWGFKDPLMLSDFRVLKDGKILNHAEWVTQAKRLETFLNQEK